MFVYSCKAATASGAVRCDESVEDGSEYCTAHADDPTPAPRPTLVLVNANIGDKLHHALRDAGVRVEHRTIGDRYLRSVKHEETAAELGRDPFAVRGEPDNRYTSPEHVDSGTPVFGSGGLEAVDVSALPVELEQAGFVLRDVRILEREGKSPRLELKFELGGEPCAITVADLHSKAIGDVFGKVHVWTNAVRDDGQVVHTVNCVARGQAAVKHVLRFAGGDYWADAV